MVLQADGNSAMILAAGMGTRLKPLTDRKPKALVEWEGIPLLEHVYKRSMELGTDDIHTAQTPDNVTHLFPA